MIYIFREETPRYFRVVGVCAGNVLTASELAHLDLFSTFVRYIAAHPSQEPGIAFDITYDKPGHEA